MKELIITPGRRALIRVFLLLAACHDVAAKVTCANLRGAFMAADCCDEATPSNASIYAGTGELAPDGFSVVFRATFADRRSLLDGQAIMNRPDVLPTTATAPGNRRLHLTSSSFGTAHFLDILEEWDSLAHYRAYLSWRACLSPLLPEDDGSVFGKCEPSCAADTPCPGGEPNAFGSVINEYVSHATPETSAFLATFIPGVLGASANASATFRY